MEKGIDYIGASVVYFCHDGKGNFLMHKRGQKTRDEQGRWDVGAGGIEFGHSVEKTLKKEIKEEYGAEVLSFEFLGFREIFREHNGRPTHWLAFDFKVLIDPKEAKNNEPHKFDEVKWFTKGTVPKVSEVHSQLPVFLKKYEDKLWT